MTLAHAEEALKGLVIRKSSRQKAEATFGIWRVALASFETLANDHVRFGTRGHPLPEMQFTMEQFTTIELTFENGKLAVIESGL